MITLALFGVVAGWLSFPLVHPIVKAHIASSPVQYD